MDQLRKYEERAKTMTMEQLVYALRDVVDTINIREADGTDMSDPYTQKLYAEFDAYTVELQKRRKVA